MEIVCFFLITVAYKSHFEKGITQSSSQITASQRKSDSSVIWEIAVVARIIFFVSFTASMSLYILPPDLTSHTGFQFHLKVIKKYEEFF